MQLCILHLPCTYPQVSSVQFQQKIYQCLNESYIWITSFTFSTQTTSLSTQFELKESQIKMSILPGLKQSMQCTVFFASSFYCMHFYSLTLSLFPYSLGHQNNARCLEQTVLILQNFSSCEKEQSRVQYFQNKRLLCVGNGVQHYTDETWSKTHKAIKSKTICIVLSAIALCKCTEPSERFPMEQSTQNYLKILAYTKDLTDSLSKMKHFYCSITAYLGNAFSCPQPLHVLQADTTGQHIQDQQEK